MTVLAWMPAMVYWQQAQSAGSLQLRGCLKSTGECNTRSKAFRSLAFTQTLPLTSHALSELTTCRSYAPKLLLLQCQCRALLLSPSMPIFLSQGQTCNRQPIIILHRSPGSESPADQHSKGHIHPPPPSARGKGGTLAMPAHCGVLDVIS